MKIAVIMGSKNDLPIMQGAIDVLKDFEIDFEVLVVSAHRTPEYMYDFCKTADQNYDVIIAGAGGSAHLPGMVAAMTQRPVIGVPIKLKALDGMDSLLSIVQMPGGIPVLTVAINNSKNAAIGALRILAINDKLIYQKLVELTNKTKDEVLNG